jgi:succinate dehydrogenase cytochrome b556 subunit
MVSSNKPTSPFLTVYRIQSGSFFSIFSRITGVYLLFCLVTPICAFHLAKTGVSFYPLYSLLFFVFKSPYDSVFFSFLLVTFLTSLLYHLFAAVRYIFWSQESSLQHNIFNLRDLKKTQRYLLLFPIGLVVFSWILFFIL